MKIHLPNSAFLGNIDPFLRSYNPLEQDRLVITANPKWISIHPVVLSMIASLGLRLDASSTEFENLQATSKHYLQRMGLFEFLGLDSGMSITSHEAAGRFIPLTHITNSKQLSHCITDLIPLLHLEAQHAQAVAYVMSELVRNVLEHAQSAHGAVLCAQYYRKSNTLRVGIADTGIGILKSMSQSHKVHTHLEAIRLSLMPGITGTTSKEGGTEFNAGAGLFFTKSIASVNRGFFLIYSGTALYKLLKNKPGRTPLHADPFAEKYSVDEQLPYWQGTLVGVDIPLSTTREFSSLLEDIHTTYIASVRERKKQRRRPTFI